MTRSSTTPAFIPTKRSRIHYVIATAVLSFVCTVALLFWALRGVQLPNTAQITSERVIVMQTADGQPLLRQGSFRLAPIDVKNMPANVVNAVLSIEDRRYYEHGGVDLRAIARALFQNTAGGEIVSGGSTITQQLVKTLFLTPQRTYRRKVDEAIIALSLEWHLTKDQILTSYLNNVYFGSGATGFPAAAQRYFGKTVADLTLPEAAMLAGMINAPNEYNPLHDLSAARSRAGVVLDAMVENGKLSPSAALVAKLHPATPSPTEVATSAAGWFGDWIYDKAATAAPALAGTVRVRTTLDPRLQDAATQIVQSTLAQYGAEKHASQAALVAMRSDGAVVAMVGGRSYAESQYNRAVQAKRQPGSAFKLFDYYAALRHGFTPNDEILDAPIDVNGWTPDNYAAHYHGRVTLAQAFAHSLNAATVRLSQQVGIDQVIAAARDLGLRAPLGHNPSLALGTSEVSLLDLTAAYASVRAGAAPVVPWGIASVRLGDANNEVPVGGSDVAQHSLGQYQNELIDLLQGVVREGTGRAAALPGFAAGKTGTSQDYRDAWFIGFTDSLVVGVWVGNDDHSPMKNVTGGSLPAMIWKRFMEQAEVAAAASATPATPAEDQGPSKHTFFDQADVAASAPTPSATCNASLCERSYHSFRASDCTYQPYSGGPRRLCEQ